MQATFRRCPDKHLCCIRSHLEVRNYEWRNQKSSDLLQTLFQSHINYINAFIQKLRPVECVKQSDSNNSERDIASLLEKKFEFYEEEILIKVESVKAQIDKFKKLVLKKINLKMRKQSEPAQVMRFYEINFNYMRNQKKPLRNIKRENVFDMKIIAYFSFPSINMFSV